MNSKRSRKPLNDALAEQFIYGDTSPVAGEPPLDATPSEPFSTQDSVSPNESVTAQNTGSVPLETIGKKINTSLLMKKLQSLPKEATVRLTVDLSASMHRKLSIMAARTGKKKVEIVRFLLDEALKNVKE